MRVSTNSWTNTIHCGEKPREKQEITHHNHEKNRSSSSNHSQRRQNLRHATRYGEWQDWWEFPGGKIEAGETPEEALRREIREELSTEIGIDRFLCTVEYDYPAFHLTMHCYLCSLLSDTIHLNEHEAAKWLTKEQLNTVKWLPADKAILEKELYN